MKVKALLLFFLLAAFACADDQVVSVDPSGTLITVQQHGALKSYRLKPFTDITLNGQKATPTQLKAGMQVNISLADAQTNGLHNGMGIRRTISPVSCLPSLPLPERRSVSTR